MRHTIPFGTSEPQDFALTQSSGAVVVGTGIDIALEIALRSGDGTVAVTSPPTVAWLDRLAGTVRVTGTEALAVGSYLVRFQLTDGGGQVGFVPNGEKADVWHVVPVPNF